MWDVRKKLGIALFAFLLLILFGMFGYSYLEKWPLFDSLYMTIITIGTVGFSEVHTLDQAGRIFTIVLIILGLSTATYFFSLVSKAVLEGELNSYFGRQKMLSNIEKLRNHYIICGYGRFGSYIAKEFKEQKVPFVIVESDEKSFAKIGQDGYLGLFGDSTDDEALIKAGIQHAICLIAVASTDAVNLFITISARHLNPKIIIVTRAQEDYTEKKMLLAGANKVVSTYKLGANQLAQLALRPTVIDFIEIATRSANMEFNMEEITVPDNSSFIEKSLKELALSRAIGIIIIGIKRADKMIFNPSGDTIINHNDILIAMGTKEQLDKLAKLAEQK